MEQQLNPKANKIRVYSVGGTGANICREMVERGLGDTYDGAAMEFCFIDTSMANLSGWSRPDQVYVIGNGNGSGGVRGANFDQIKQSMPDIVKRFKPADINLIICSYSGGSGAMISGVLAQYLLSNGQAVAVLAVTDTTSKNETMNTIKGLQTTDSIADRLAAPLVICEFENRLDNSIHQVNNMVRARIAMLAAAFSGKNPSIDLADIKNFLDYTKTTSYPARASALDIHFGSNIVTEHPVISLLTLTTPDVSGTPNVPVEYRKCGELNEGVFRVLKDTRGFALPVHLTINQGYIHDRMAYFQERLRWFEEQRAATDKPVLAAVKVNDDGFAL